jgi:hypothetical protein
VEFKDKAVTYVLTGGVLAAFLGPLSGSYTQFLFPIEYVGSYLVMAVYAMCNQSILHIIEFPSAEDLAAPDAAEEKEETVDEEGCDFHQIDAKHCIMQSFMEPRVRPLVKIVTQPLFVLACTTATVAHTVMVMFMAVFTIAMDNEEYRFSDISNVMLMHLLAMFLPGFVTGSLISYYGTFAVSIGGAACFALAVVALLNTASLWSYYVGMVFVGLAWNLSFSAGTVMLTSCYTVCTTTDYTIRVYTFVEVVV